MQRSVLRAVVAGVTAALAAGCQVRNNRRAGLPHEPSAACPRDAVRDRSGRCACVDRSVPLLGACVPAEVGDAYCGPAARSWVRSTPLGMALETPSFPPCVFHECDEGGRLDVATGRCLREDSLERGQPPCKAASTPIVEAGLVACAPPSAACPRGTWPAEPLPGRHVTSDPTECTAGPRCPPGSVSATPTAAGRGAQCRAIVYASDSMHGGAAHRVDVGAWAIAAFGVDGGNGSPELCRPLLQRPSLFDEPGPRVRITLVVPDADVSRVHARVEGWDDAGRPLSPSALEVLEMAVSTLLEVFRGFGGESTAVSVEVGVQCPLWQ